MGPCSFVAVDAPVDAFAELRAPKVLRRGSAHGRSGVWHSAERLLTWSIRPIQNSMACARHTSFGVEGICTVARWPQ
jgi:hypothetical protein